MKKLIFALAAAVTMVAGAAQAERYVMVTHGEGKDPFWPVVQKGGEDAARHVGADFEYIFTPSGDMGDMAKSITAAAATQPDGIVVSLPDPDALGGAIKAAVAAGIPVITMNSGLESSKDVGALMHVGQPEYLAGQAAGARAKAEGATKGVCFIQEAYNTAQMTVVTVMVSQCQLSWWTALMTLQQFRHVRQLVCRQILILTLFYLSVHMFVQVFNKPLTSLVCLYIIPVLILARL